MVLPTAGSYVVAVSGGVDSMALLHLLREQASKDKTWKLVVAHLDHGIREDSAEDRKLVQSAANGYRLPFVYHEARLGPGTSEAEARQARYDFLRSVQRASRSRAIITAHHQDDLLETAIINLLRGTGRKGLTALSSREETLRPALGVTKSALLAYARENNLMWREDITNQNTIYLRNYVRHKLLPRFSKTDIAKLITIVTKSAATNQALDSLLANLLKPMIKAGRIDRQWFNGLPHNVAREVLAAWLRAFGIRDFDRKALERLVVAAKVAAAGKIFPVMRDCVLVVNVDNLALSGAER